MATIVNSKGKSFIKLTPVSRRDGNFFSKGIRFTYQSHNIKSLKETSLGSDLTAVSNQSSVCGAG